MIVLQTLDLNIYTSQERVHAIVKHSKRIKEI